MKKQLLIASILASSMLMFNSCKKNDSQSSPDLLKGPKMLATAGDGLNDLLGYGYDVVGEYANSSAAKFAIIDVARLKLEQPTRVEWDLSSKKYGEIIAGESAVSYSSTLVEKLGAGATIADPTKPPSTDPKVTAIPLFKGSISSSFDNSDNFSSKYVYSNYGLVIQQKRVKLNASLAILQQYLTPSFIADVQSGTPQDIVSSYGTHVLKDIILGAKLDISYRAETNSSNRKQAATDGIDINILGIFSINSSNTSTSTQTNDNTNQRLAFKCIGGEPSASLTGNIAIGTTLPVISTTQWENSSTLQNAEMIDIAPGGLIPIWDLIADPIKSAAVKSYVTQYLLTNQVYLTPATIYEYYNQVTDKHAYSFASTVNWSNYHNNAEPFKAYITQYAGSVPLYQFYNPSIDNRVLTTNRYPGYSGYNYDKIICYVYQTQVPGTVPVYEFYNWPGGHLYTTNSNPGFAGWSNNGQPFYAFPN